MFSFAVASQTSMAEEARYGGAGASRSAITGKGYETSLKGTGYKAYLGYKLNEHNALEMAYVNFGDIDANSGERFSGSAIQINWMYFIPVAQQFRLSAGLGGHKWWTDMTNRAVSMRDQDAGLSYSLGFEIDLTSAAGLRFEYETFETGSTKVNQYGFSLFKRF